MTVKVKRIAATVLVFLLFAMALCELAAAFTPYDSFNFVYRKGELNRTSAPAPYYPERIVDQVNEKQRLIAPSDLFSAPDGSIYITDKSAGLLIKMTAALETEWVLESPLGHGDDKFNSPQGVFVDDNGIVFVADTENHRIILLDSAGNYIREIGKPDSEILAADFVFSPRKIAVAGGNRLLVLTDSQVNGIMEFDTAGQFIGFFGSNEVKASPLEILFRRIMTQEQRDKMIQFVPLECYNLCVDSDGFIYAVTKATDEDKKVKKLNLGGQDVLIRSEYMMMATKMSQIEDICVDRQGNCSYIDSRDGKIYTYNQDGYLLYAFGALSDQAGTFAAPSAIDYAGDRLLVSDSVRGTVTVFRRTPYAQAIEDAGVLFRQQEYEESRGRWEEILRMNCNFELAYIQIGRILYRQDDFRGAMEYFKKGNFRGENYVSGYGMAFEKYRAVFLQENLSVILTILIILIAGFAAFMIARHIRRKRKRWKQ